MNYQLLGLISGHYILVTDVDEVNCVPYDPLTVIQQVREKFGKTEKIYYYNQTVGEVHEMVMNGNQFLKFNRLPKNIEEGVIFTASIDRTVQNNIVDPEKFKRATTKVFKQRSDLFRRLA